MVSEQGIQLREGTLLEGKYLLERELGAGGMGQVYLARDKRIDRLVAIKLLHRELAADPAVRKRFETEARAIGKLRHPNCVLLYEFGYSEELGALFAIFEYADGKSLESWVGQQLPVGHVLEIGRQVAEGMHHAHEQKIIHRDLKPDNIMVSFNEEGHLHAKVLDFGIARIAEDDEKSTRLTKMGQMFGTPPYMSPEQIRAKLDVGPRTDIYSIGIILYEMLEGRLPFIGGSAIETCMSHLNDEVPPMDRQDVPEELRAIVARCLEKHAEDRFESCKKLARALEDVEWSRTETMPGLPAVVQAAAEPQRPDTGIALSQRSTGGELGAEETALKEMGTASTLLDASGSYSVVQGGEAEGDREERAAAVTVASPAAAVAPPAAAAVESARSEQVMTYAPQDRKPLVLIALILLGVVLLSALAFAALRGREEPDESGERVVAEVEPRSPLGGVVEEEPVEDVLVAVEEPVEEAAGEEAPMEAEVEVEEEPAVAEEAPVQERRVAPVEEVRPATTPRPAPREERVVRPSVQQPAQEEETSTEEPTEPASIRLGGRRRGDSSQEEQEEAQEPAGLTLPRRN